MTRKYEEKKITPSVLRKITIALVFVVVVLGLAFHTGTGTLSSTGWDYVAAICPLGALEAMLGGGGRSCHDSSSPSRP